MSFNDGFSSRGIDSISGSDGEVLTRVAGQWTSAPNTGTGGSFSGITLDPVNSNLEGHGTALEPLKVKSSLNVTAITASSGFSGDGYLVTNLSTSVDHVLYVAHDGDDNHVGSLTDPFRSISGAIAYASIKYPNNTDSVLIEVRPGTYTEDLLITRPNLYIRGAAVRPEQRSVQITGKTKVNVSANDKYNSTVAFQGVFFNHNSSSPVVNLSSSTNLTYFKDCYFAANGSNCLKIENVTTASAKIVVSECIFWKGTGNGDIIDISGGDAKIDSCEMYFTSTATGTGNAIVQSGNSLVSADRILIDLNNNIVGSCIKNSCSNITGRPTLLLSNASLSSITSTDGSVYSTNITYLWNVSFANSAKIKGLGPLATVVYSDLTSVNGLTFESINKSLLNDYMGNVSGSSFSGSFKGDGSQITNLPLSNYPTKTEVTGVLNNYATLTGVSASFARLDLSNTFTADQIINGNISSSYITSSGGHLTYLDFDTTITPPTNHIVGRVHYDSVSGDLKYHTDISANTVNLGQQLVQKVQYNDGGTLTKGTVVHISGLGNGNVPKVSKASVTSDNLSANTLGVALEDIISENQGYVILQGVLSGFPVSNTYNAGDVLYLSGSAGEFSTEKTVAPNHLVSIGQVLKTGGGTAGSIYVKIQNGYELSELHDVSASNLVNNNLLSWDSTKSVWKNTSNLGSYTFNGNQQVTGSLFVNTTISSSQFTGSFSGSFNGDASGLQNLPITGLSFSPIDVASSDLAPTADTTQYYYQTTAGATMTISKVKVWGYSGADTIFFGIYRGRLGSSPVLIGQGQTSAQVGPNVINMTAVPGQNLNVTAGEDLVVGIYQGGTSWRTVYRSGISDLLFGVSNTTNITTMPSTPPVSPASSVRFACTIY